MENPAILRGARVGALVADCPELRLQRAENPDARSHVADVLVQQRVDLRAFELRRFAQFEQPADFVMRHVQGATMQHELQMLALRLVVQAVVTFTACWRWQQALAFVVTNGFDRHGQSLCEVADAVGPGHGALGA